VTGEGVHSAYQAWQTALSIIGYRTLTIDITFVSEADERGCALLLSWHENGARIIAASPESKALVLSTK
jgi:ABC-type transporter Mla MlaB component